MSATHIDLPGNERPAKRDARKIGTADPKQLVKITVVVRGIKELPEPDPLAPMPIAEIEREYGADPADIKLVERALKVYGLRPVKASPGTRTVDFEGTVSQMNEAFHVDLGEYESPKQGRFRGREGGIRIPKELGGVVSAVLGLDERQVARRREARRRARTAGATVAAQGPSDLEQRYSFSRWHRGRAEDWHPRVRGRLLGIRPGTLLQAGVASAAAFGDRRSGRASVTVCRANPGNLQSPDPGK